MGFQTDADQMPLSANQIDVRWKTSQSEAELKAPFWKPALVLKGVLY